MKIDIINFPFVASCGYFERKSRLWVCNIALFDEMEIQILNMIWNYYSRDKGSQGHVLFKFNTVQ